MSFKVIRPFVYEMISLLLIIFIISGLLWLGLVEIRIHRHILTIGFVFVIVLPLCFSFIRIMNLGIRSLFDYFFRLTVTDIYVFLEIQPYKASHLREKVDSDHTRITQYYYLIQVKKNDKNYTFISSSYVEMMKGTSYAITTGRFSNVFVNYQDTKAT